MRKGRAARNPSDPLSALEGLLLFLLDLHFEGVVGFVGVDDIEVMV